MHKYLIIIERGENGFGAYSPDLPGCIATGKTLDDVEQRMLNAMQGHCEYLLEQGLPVPEPTTAAAFMMALPVASTASSAA